MASRFFVWSALSILTGTTLVVAIVGCTRADREVLRQSTEDPPEISMSVFPTPGSGVTVLEEGQLLLEGEASAPAGWREVAPLTIQVTDLTNGTSVYKDVEDMASTAGLTTTFFDRETGEFVIDAEEELAIAGGLKRVIVRVHDAEDQFDSWQEDYQVESILDPPETAMMDAREAYAPEIYEILDGYNDWINTYSFSSSAFPYQTLDRDLGEATSGFWLETMVENPDLTDWDTTATDYFETADDLLGDLTGLSEAEASYRENLQGWMVDWGRVLSFHHGWYCGWQIGQRDVVPSTKQRLAAIDLYEHTFAQVTTSNTLDGGMNVVRKFEARLYQDTGAPNKSTLLEYDPEDLEPDTADPDEYVWRVTVTAIDNFPPDNVLDSLTFEGIDESYLEGEAFDDTDHYGHLITPLRYLFSNAYAYTGGL